MKKFLLGLSLLLASCAHGGAGSGLEGALLSLVEITGSERIFRVYAKVALHNYKKYDSQRPFDLEAYKNSLPDSADITPTETTHGCVMLFCNVSGGGTFQYFVKVADSEYDDEDGESQIWGYDPMNKLVNSNGDIIYQRVLKKDFIRAGSFGRKGGCQYHCPLW